MVDWRKYEADVRKEYDKPIKQKVKEKLFSIFVEPEDKYLKRQAKKLAEQDVYEEEEFKERIKLSRQKAREKYKSKKKKKYKSSSWGIPSSSTKKIGFKYAGIPPTPGMK